MLFMFLLSGWAEVVGQLRAVVLQKILRHLFLDDSLYLPPQGRVRVQVQGTEEFGPRRLPLAPQKIQSPQVVVGHGQVRRQLQGFPERLLCPGGVISEEKSAAQQGVGQGGIWRQAHQGAGRRDPARVAREPVQIETRDGLPDRRVVRRQTGRLRQPDVGHCILPQVGVEEAQVEGEGRVLRVQVIGGLQVRAGGGGVPLVQVVQAQQGAGQRRIRRQSGGGLQMGARRPGAAYTLQRAPQQGVGIGEVGHPDRRPLQRQDGQSGLACGQRGLPHAGQTDSGLFLLQRGQQVSGEGSIGRAQMGPGRRRVAEGQQETQTLPGLRVGGVAFGQGLAGGPGILHPSQPEVPARDQREHIRVIAQGQRAFPLRDGPFPIPLRGVEGRPQRGHLLRGGPPRLRLIQRGQPLRGTVPVPIEAGQPQVGGRALRTGVRRLVVGHLGGGPLPTGSASIPHGQQGREGVGGARRGGRNRRSPAGGQKGRQQDEVKRET